MGSLKPNDFGLFDMHGNVYTWCQERLKSYPQGRAEKPEEDKEDVYIINFQFGRVLRGGSFHTSLGFVRCASGIDYLPLLRIGDVGFRPAKTLTP